MRLIDGDALIDKYGEWYVEELTEMGYIGTIKRIVNSMPTVEPERKKGKWELLTDERFDIDYYKCSECGYEPYRKMDISNFCPNCGCQMEVGEK